LPTFLVLRSDEENPSTTALDSGFSRPTRGAISLTFDEGRIVRATGTPQEKVDAIFATDEGACYLGEFALGLNAHIERPMKDTLYDEKIRGSLHVTPGDAYEGLADNGNRSAVHWDLVLIQTPEWGAERSPSTGSWCGGTDASCCRSWLPSTPADLAGSWRLAPVRVFARPSWRVGARRREAQTRHRI
jgi:hypothetical protein